VIRNSGTGTISFYWIFRAHFNKFVPMHETSLLEDQPIAWTPTPEVTERAQLTKFMKQVGVATWEELYTFSIRDVEKFTEEVLKFLDIKFDPPCSHLLDTSDGVEFPRWFAANAERGMRNAESDDSDSSLVTSPSSLSAGLNITTMCLDRWQTDEMRDQPAVIWEGEDGNERTLSYSKLFQKVRTCASGLVAEGFRKGDAIGIHMPMIPETLIALLAVGRIGAIAVPVFSGYGVEAIASRLRAVNAKGLFTCDGFKRRGKMFGAFEIAEQAIAITPSMRKMIVTLSPENAAGVPIAEPVMCEFADLMHYGIKFGQNNIYGFEPTSAEDPLIILYTSGTTGKPKGIAHTHASFPIKAAQDMAFGTDVGRGTRISWYTDIGWMMGPWLIYGALINGATICIYDGAPDYPTADRMWEFCAKHKVEILGISPTLVRALAAHEEGRATHQATGAQASSPPEAEGPKSGHGSTPQSFDAAEAATLQAGMPGFQSVDDVAPQIRNPQSAIRDRHDLSSLRAFASTGEPWNPAPWWWLFKEVGNSKLPIINYSGGTEIAGGILMGNPLLPIKPCSFPAPCPGMDIDILDEEGNPVGPNQVGELVIKQPWIGMARGFWQEKERYLDTYWRRFKNIWVHGDWAMRDKDGHWFILGRSDDTLKVAGKRVGPAEVESLLVAHPLVTEAAVIGVPDEAKGTAMVAFCVLKAVTSDEGQVTREVKATSDEGRVTSKKEDAPPPSSSSLVPHHSSLEAELKALVARDMGKPLAPSKIHFVSALPKTRNAKVMRRVLRSAYLGEDPGDLSALENPAAVDELRSLAKIKA
jgi:acetyl-CoA synthetase